MTTNPEHRLVCAECKTPYRFAVKQVAPRVVILNGIGSFLRTAFRILALLLLLCVGGYVLKIYFFVLTLGDSGILWRTLNAYHFFLGFNFLLSLVSFYSYMQRYLDGFPPMTQRLIVLGAVLTTVPLLGYAGQYVLILLSRSVWNWEVSFGTGLWMSYLVQANVLTPMLHTMERQRLATEEVEENFDHPTILNHDGTDGQLPAARHHSADDDTDDEDDTQPPPTLGNGGFFRFLRRPNHHAVGTNAGATQPPAEDSERNNARPAGGHVPQRIV
jgi:hypothetical protein